jgi:hypothetical protein
VSSKRRLRRNACGNKVRHLTAIAARAAIRRQVQRLQSTGAVVGHLQAYRCPFCHGWHVGHSKKVRW